MLDAKMTAMGELRENEGRLRLQALIFENATDAIMILDLQQCIVDWNPASERLFGYGKDEVLGRTTEFLYQPEEYAEYPKLIDETLARGERWAMELVMLCKDGAERMCETISAPLLDAGGLLIGRIGVTRDITERKRMEEELRTSHQQLRALAARLNVVREEEAAALARDIHDDLGKALTALKLDLFWLTSRFPEDMPALTEKAGSMAELVDATIRSVHDIGKQLRPRILDDLGLIPAVEWQTQEFQKRTGIKCAMVASMDAITLGPERSTVIFRIVQEALTNVARHATATRVDIDFHEETGCLMLEIRDNGKGIRADEIANAQSLGLLGMQERALVLSGQLTVEGFRGKGTVVRLRLPFPAQ